MKNRIQIRGGRVLFAAAAVWAGSFAFVTPSFATDPAPVDTAKSAERATAADAANDNRQAADQLAKTNDALGKSTVAMTPAPAAAEIRQSLAATTEAALTKGGFKDVVKHLVDADRTRLSTYTSQDGFAKLDGRIESFHKDWRSKYGEDFSFSKNADAILGDTFGRISQGEIGERKGASGVERPSNQPTVIAGTADALKESGVSNTDANSNKFGGGDTNKDIGRNIATVLIPASGNMPEVAIPMIHELPNSWRIDLPDNVDGQKLEDNLLKHLTMVDEDRVNWPADQYDAYRTVARHMMTAIMENDGARETDAK